jgi:hypothetical protein
MNRQERMDVTCAALLAAVLLILLGAFIPRAEAAPATLQPCATEDYSGPDACYWDAAQRGNHQGRSFTWNGASAVYGSK